MLCFVSVFRTHDPMKSFLQLTKLTNEGTEVQGGDPVGGLDRNKASPPGRWDPGVVGLRLAFMD